MTNKPDIFEPHELPVHDQRLIKVYMQVGCPVDALAYSAAFDKLYNILTSKGETRGREELFRRLLNLRKAGRLPRLASHQ